MTKEFSEKDWEIIELYMKSGATQQKICESFAVNPDTINTKFKKRYGEGYATTCNKFRRTGELLIEATQFQKALAGDIKMLIWLGKVKCGQRENESLSNVAPAQNEIDKDHVIMQLKHENAKLLERLGIDGDKPQAG
jgi:hypothetical protein